MKTCTCGAQQKLFVFTARGRSFFDHGKNVIVSEVVEATTREQLREAWKTGVWATDNHDAAYALGGRENIHEVQKYSGEKLSSCVANRRY